MWSDPVQSPDVELNILQLYEKRSIPPRQMDRFMLLVGNQRLRFEPVKDEDELIEKIPEVQRIRFLHPDNVSQNIYNAIADKAIYIASENFVSHGRLELMHYFIEQSISNSYHRYGNLGIQSIKLEEI